MRLRRSRVLTKGLVGAAIVMIGLAVIGGRALAAPPTINPASLPAGQVGVAYSQTLTASGSTAPYTWAVTAGSLPAGVSLSSAGVVSGTPTTAGTANFTVQATSATPEVNTKAYSIVVSPAALAVTTTSLPAGVVSTAYNSSVAATGGTPPYTWSITGGALPGGLTLNASTGAITGTPSAAATANFTVQAADSAAHTAPKALSITVTSTPPLAVATTSLAAGNVGVGYSQTLAATGGTAPYAWAVTAGALPAGLTLNSSGAITGTPSTATTANFTVTVVDSGTPAVTAPKALSIMVSAAPALSVVTSALPDALLNNSYASSISASGGTPPYTWTIAGGSLPPGMYLDTSGLISGTPYSTGSFSFTAMVTDAAAASTQGAFTITVTDGASSVSILTSSLSSGTVGSSYSEWISVSGGSSPYTWTITSGSLPSGLSLDSDTGVISGTPSASGDYSFTVVASDIFGVTASMSYTISITGGSLTINESTLPSASPGASYSTTFSVSGGTSPYSWTVSSGALPDGLSLDSSTGTISGTVSGIASGTATFTVRVTDAGSQTGARDLSIEVVAVGFVGPAPARGSTGLLVVRGGATASSLSNTLSTAGCTVESLAVLRNGTWLLYVVGAPAVVNAAFPASLADVTPFFVRCR